MIQHPVFDGETCERWVYAKKKEDTTKTILHIPLYRAFAYFDRSRFLLYHTYLSCRPVRFYDVLSPTSAMPLLGLRHSASSPPFVRS